MKRKIAILLIVVLLLTALGGCKGAKAAIPVLIDCDPGMDDAIALGLVASSEKLDIVALCAVQGNVTLDRGSFNLLELAHLYGIDAPVYVGRDMPLEGDGYRASYYHGANGIAGAMLPATDRAPEITTAWDAIYEQAKLADGKLQILALGPLTNIATAFEKHPDLPAMLDRIVVMGGAVARGNETAYAEFNIYNDPYAAQIVFESGVETVMVSLEAGMRAYLTDARIAELCGLDPANAHYCALACLYGPIRTHMQALGKDNMAFNADGGLILCDPLAAAYMLDSFVAKGYRANVTVDVSHGERRGQTVVEPDKNGKVMVLDTADNAKLDKMIEKMFAYFDARGPVEDAVPFAEQTDSAELGLLVGAGSPETIQTEVSDVTMEAVIQTAAYALFTFQEQYHELNAGNLNDMLSWPHLVAVRQDGKTFELRNAGVGWAYMGENVPIRHMYYIAREDGFDGAQPYTLVFDGQSRAMDGLSAPAAAYQTNLYDASNAATPLYIVPLGESLWGIINDSRQNLQGFCYTQTGEMIELKLDACFAGLTVIESNDRPVHIEFEAVVQASGADVTLAVMQEPQFVNLNGMQLMASRVTLQDGSLSVLFEPKQYLYITGMLGTWEEIEAAYAERGETAVSYGTFDPSTCILTFSDVQAGDGEVKLYLYAQAQYCRPNYVLLPS